MEGEKSQNDATANASKDSLRWANDFPALTDAAMRLITDYANVPKDEVEDHVRRIREQAFAVHPYPCIGHFRFLDLGLYSFPIHDEIVTRIMSGQKYLDLGCCFGQEIRYLVSQGCPSENLYGADLRPVFIEYGYELFRDKNTLKSEFLAPADIFVEEPLSQLDGQLDIINASSFFHLFSWDDSIKVAKRVVRLLKQVKGSTLIGRQVGRDGEAGPKGDDENNQNYRHNSESWRKMWIEIGEATNSKWDIEFWWDETRASRAINNRRPDGDIQRFCFVVRRL